jgi:rare lipoprotein A
MLWMRKDIVFSLILGPPGRTSEGFSPDTARDKRSRSNTTSFLKDEALPNTPLQLLTKKMTSRIAAILSLLSVVGLYACSTSRQEVTPGSGAAVASWYGPDFHGRPTSSGEIFNMYSLTCAHRTYPFGTKLKVTNTANKKTVECIVNDRGPFVEGRDIDLSYAAARKIGVIGHGSAEVLIEVNGRDSSYIRKVRVQEAGKSGPFAIQVGSFSEGINAIRLKKALNLKYGNVYIQEVDIKGSTYYRVRVGNYDALPDAVLAAEQLGQEGYPVKVVRADTRI